MHLYYGLGNYMMLYKIFKITTMILFFILSSCRPTDNMGFYQPMTLDLKVPDGPPEFKAGWHAGCKSAIGASYDFKNSIVYQGEFVGNYGSGVYQHDPYFQDGWRLAFFSCASHIGNFVNFNSMQHSPLSK